MQQNQEQNHVTPPGDPQESFNDSTEKNPRNDWAGEDLEGSGFEKEVPEPGFEWQE
jgi:hypothetical protein